MTKTRKAAPPPAPTVPPLPASSLPGEGGAWVLADGVLRRDEAPEPAPETPPSTEA